MKRKMLVDIDELAEFRGNYADQSKLLPLLEKLPQKEWLNQADLKVSAVQGSKRAKIKLLGFLEKKQSSSDEKIPLVHKNLQRENSSVPFYGSYSAELDESVIVDPIDKANAAFTNNFIAELNNVNTCYMKHLDVLNKRLLYLRKEISSRSIKIDPRNKMNADESIDDLNIKEEFQDLYRSMHHLKNYCIANYRIFLAFLTSPQASKAMDRSLVPMLTGLLRARDFAHNSQGGESFRGTKRLEIHNLQQLIHDTKVIYAKNYCRGNRKLAKFSLLEKRRVGGNAISWSDVMVGLPLGMTLMTLVWVTFDLSTPDIGRKHPYFRISLMETGAYRAYRAFGLIICLIWSVGTSLTVFRESRINFAVILDLKPTHVPSAASFFVFASRITTFYFLSLLLFIKTANGEMMGYGIPPSLTGYMALSLIAVFSAAVVVFYTKAYGGMQDLPRRLFAFFKQPWSPMWSLLVFCIGLSKTTFRSALIGDYMTSSIKILVDLAYVACYFFRGELITDFESSGLPSTCSASPYLSALVPIIMCWPLWLRMVQNLKRFYYTKKAWPFLANAIKYGLTHTVVIFSSMHPDLMSTFNSTSTISWNWRMAFYICFALSTLITYSWDIFMDWGLGYKEYGYLRRRLMFRRRYVYYLAIFGDLFMRFLWTVTLLAYVKKDEYWIFLNPALSAVEIVRRTYWSFLRFEHEHLSNTLAYRKVDFIPLYFDTAYQKHDDDDKKLSNKVVMMELALFSFIVMLFVFIAVTI